MMVYGLDGRWGTAHDEQPPRTPMMGGPGTLWGTAAHVGQPPRPPMWGGPGFMYEVLPLKGGNPPGRTRWADLAIKSVTTD